jgi:hypothetical protein
MALPAREGAEMITSIRPAGEREKVTASEAMDIPRAPRLLEATDEFSSPACLMHEASDAYMGYADKAELVAFLNLMLEAERAGERVTLEIAPTADTEAIRELLRVIQEDEARWVRMLLLHIKAIGAEPSSGVCAVYGKALAIADLRALVAFLSRGQEWVVKRLREMLPRVRDDSLHADLSAMLRSHEVNIDRANALRSPR